ncbi:hypothetical protein KEJ50_05800 [Candidatus Bathyarchaeota archaeon]|nr:hypothetical protein [Candidatus Bathyarchaeota archaeon]
MIIPVKKLTIITLINNEKKLLDRLGKLGVIQLRKLNEKEFIGFKEVTSKEIREYEALYERLHTLKKLIEEPEKASKPLAHTNERLVFEKMEESTLTAKGPSYNAIKKMKSVKPKEKLSVGGPALPYWPRKTIQLIKPEETKSIEYSKNSTSELYISSIEELKEITSSLEEKIRTTVERLKLLKDAKPALQILKAQKINPENIGMFGHIFAKAGIAKTQLMPFFRLTLKNYKSIAFKEAPISSKETFIYITGLTEFKPYIEELLNTIEFKEFNLPQGLPGKVEEDLIWIDEEAKRLEDKLHKLKEDLLSLEPIIIYSLNIYSAQSNLLRSRMMVVLQGWIPENKIKSLNAHLESLNKEVGGSIFFYYDDPLPDEDVPTVMENPKLFKVYEVLTRQYGYPSHEEADPTIISTILWVTMFGVMFPDFGQGLIILSLGLLFGFVLKRNVMGLNFAKLGKLMIGLGLSAMVFGLLAGEFFLLEVKPLWPGLIPGWVKTPSNVVWLIKIAIFFGITQIILALALSIKNYLKAKEYMEALLSEKGLAGLITFLGIVFTAFHFLGITVIPGVLTFPELKMNVLKHWSLVLTIIGVIAIALKPILTKEGATMSLGVLIETLISSLANMLSYARIAGFCIAHAAFALVVAELMHANPALGIGLGLIFLNLFSLTLEMMVVMIQALRLLYYEFSTKFFKGTGKPYTPYKITI